MAERTEIEDIKDKLDIVSVVQQYVPTLKRSGRNFFGLCPFHKEKTPSFSVNPELKMFKCFGCGEGGDVIKFIEKIEGLDFPKALEVAAQRAGVTLKHTYSPQDKQRSEERERLLQANKLAAEFYHYILLEHPSGEPGRIYARKRKLKKNGVNKFLIGYAPKAYENLKRFLIKKGYKVQELLKWGLLVEKNGRIYDKFRNRLMFTISNHQGDVVGFSGRLIDPEALGPKYLNSPETPVYKKSTLLFGLYQAKESIRKEGFAILVEGNIDLLSSHGAGVENIVAPLGTALTMDQVNLLKRYCDKVYFALDTDTAGQKALLKDLELLEQAGMQSYVLEIGAYKDVDDLIIAGGDWSKVVASPEEVVPYFMSSFLKKYDLKQSFQKKEYTKAILVLISKIRDKIVQADYLKKLADETGVGIKVLYQELTHISLPQAQTSSENGSVLDDLPEPLPKREQDLLCHHYLALMIEHKRFRTEIKEQFPGDLLPTEEFRKVCKAIWDPSRVNSLNPSEQAIYTDVNLRAVPSYESWHELEKELSQVTNRLRKEQIREELEKIRRGRGSMEDLNLLARELSRLKNIQ